MEEHGQEHPCHEQYGHGLVGIVLLQQNIQYTSPQTTKDEKPSSGLRPARDLRVRRSRRGRRDLTHYRNCIEAPGHGAGVPLNP